MLHPSSVAAAIAVKGQLPVNVDNGNVNVNGNYEKRRAELKVDSPQRAGMLIREKSQTLFGYLTISSRHLGQRGSHSKLGTDYLPRSNSFGSMASGSVNGIFGDSGDSDFVSSDDDDVGKAVRPRQSSRSERSPWMTLDQLSSSQEDQPVTIFDLKNNAGRQSGALMDNLSVSNAAEDDDFLNLGFSGEDAFRSMEELNGSKSSILAQRLTPASPPRFRGKGGRHQSSIRRIVAVDRKVARQEQKHSPAPMTNRFIQLERSSKTVQMAYVASTSQSVGRSATDPFIHEGPISFGNQQSGGVGSVKNESKDLHLKASNQQHQRQAYNHGSSELVVPALAVPDVQVDLATTRSHPSYASNLITTACRKDGLVFCPRHNNTPGPCFQQFALFSIERSTLAASIADETMFLDEGPRHLDAFSMSQVDTAYVFPQNGENHLSPEKLTQFCIPDGLQVRLIPTVAIEGAKRLGWLGKDGDCRYVFNISGDSHDRQHGIAIRVCEVVALPAHEMAHFVRTVRMRQRRRSAATKISRWFKLLQRQDLIITEALRISGYPKHPKDFKRILTVSDLRRLDRKISNNNAGYYFVNSVAIEDKSAAQIFAILEGALKPFVEEAGVHERPSMGLILTRSLGNRKLSSAERSPFRNGRRFGASTRMVKSERIAARSVSTRVVARERRVSSERITFAPSFRKILTSSEAFDKDRQIPAAIMKLAKEALEAAEYAEMRGYVVLVEKCYAMVGCRSTEQVLLLKALQQLVDAEREESNNLRRHLSGLNPSQRSRLGKVWDASERRVHSFLEGQRDKALTSMLQNLDLTAGQRLVVVPESELMAIRGPQNYFETRLCIPGAVSLKIPLPLPNIAREWGLAKLLLSIGPDSLVQAVKLLLVERSFLIVGDNREEITACCFALLELMAPYEWVHLFLPVLSRKMFDSLVLADQPFIAGLASHDLQRVKEVENDDRILQAGLIGMNVINLSSGTFHITSEPGVLEMISLDPGLRDQLRNLCARLHYYIDQDFTSPITCFESFLQNGLCLRERLTLRSICSAFEGYISRLVGNFATTKGSTFPLYVAEDAGSWAEEFQSELLVQFWQRNLLFVEAMVKTKHFSAYLAARKQLQNEVEDMKNGEVGKFIANWTYNRWNNKYRQRHS